MDTPTNPRWRVNVGFTYFVEDAVDENDAEEKAYALACEDLGKYIARDAWYDVDDTWG